VPRRHGREQGLDGGEALEAFSPCGRRPTRGGAASGMRGFCVVTDPSPRSWPCGHESSSPTRGEEVARCTAACRSSSRRGAGTAGSAARTRRTCSGLIPPSRWRCGLVSTTVNEVGTEGGVVEAFSPCGRRPTRGESRERDEGLSALRQTPHLAHGLAAMSRPLPQGERRSPAARPHAGHRRGAGLGPLAPR